MQLNLEQVISLAPDAGTLDRARKLAKPGSFGNMAGNGRAIWAEIKGSGRGGYQGYVDLQGPAYRCSCPVHKQPCKHIMALLLYAAENPPPEAEPPEELRAWLEKRDGAAKRKAKSENAAPDTAAQQKRIQQREEKVRQGLDELERFLEDAVRMGLAELSKRQADTWEKIQRRLVDAQAAGLASRIEWMRRQMRSGPHWEGPVFQAMLELHLLVSAYRRQEQLAPEWAQDIREYLGWRRDSDEVLASPAVQGTWWVLSQGIRYESGLFSQSIWFCNLATGRFALNRNFAPQQNRNSLAAGFLNGSVIDAKVHYYSSHAPLRALLVHDSDSRHQPDETMVRQLLQWAHPDLDAAARAARMAQCRNPFAHEIPLLVDNLRLVLEGGRFALADGDGRLLPLALDYAQQWQLLAALGNQSAPLFLVFDGKTAKPWALLKQNRWFALNMNEGDHD